MLQCWETDTIPPPLPGSVFGLVAKCHKKKQQTQEVRLFPHIALYVCFVCVRLRLILPWPVTTTKKTKKCDTLYSSYVRVCSGISTNTIPPASSFSVDRRERRYKGKMESLKKKRKKSYKLCCHCTEYTKQVLSTKQTPHSSSDWSLVPREKYLFESRAELWDDF